MCLDSKKKICVFLTENLTAVVGKSGYSNPTNIYIMKSEFSKLYLGRDKDSVTDKTRATKHNSDYALPFS